MNKPVKQKLCWNCEGSVATHIENCPYCGVYLSPEEVEKTSSFSMLKPPYPFSFSEDENVPKAPYAPSPEEKQEEELENSLLEPAKKLQTEQILDALIPLVALTSGVVFLLFALALYLFSADGVLTLRWNADYWYIYILIALPCLLLGMKSLFKISEETSQN